MANAETITNALPVATDDSAIAPLPREVALWRIIVAEYEQAKAAQDLVGAEVEACADAARAQAPDKDEEFKPYGLTRYGFNDDRVAMVRQTELLVAAVDYKGRSPLTEDDFAAIARKAVQLVDDFLAWASHSREVYNRTFGDVEERFTAACTKRGDAQDKLLETPAPDADAMLYKLDLLTAVMTESDEQDTFAVEAIRDDAMRLFGKAE